MYYCSNCLSVFEHPLRKSPAIISSPEDAVPTLHCPECGSKSIYLRSVAHCRCCGARLTAADSEFCSLSCRSRWLELKKRQLRRQLTVQNSPIALAVRKIEIYNNRYGTDYTYGKFLAINPEDEKIKWNAKKRKKY